MEKAKRDLLDKVLEVLNKELKSLLETSENYEEDDEDNEEMKASTYLEGAQAKRAQELEDEIKAIKQVNINKSEKVVIGSLVEADVDGEGKKFFFMLPVASGEKIKINEREIFVVTPSSPIGQRLKGKKVGDYFDLPVGKITHEYEIISIH